jgi:hypothetical protein
MDEKSLTVDTIQPDRCPLNDEQSWNVPRKLVADSSFHVETSPRKLSQPLKRKLASTTLFTFQPEKSTLLSDDAPLNMPDKVKADDVFHFSRPLPLKIVLPTNMKEKSVTAAVFHDEKSASCFELE